MRKTLLFVLFIVACLIYPSHASCLDDRFSGDRKLEGKYFTVYCSRSLREDELAGKLLPRVSDKFLVGESENDLAGLLDTLYLNVCQIMDMPLYSFRGTIKVCGNEGELDEIFYRYFRVHLNTSAFYVPEQTTLYISAENFTPYVIGHEFCHVILTHYFVVPPPEKISEILSGYVEYQLRKSTQHDPS